MNNGSHTPEVACQAGDEDTTSHPPVVEEALKVQFDAHFYFHSFSFGRLIEKVYVF